MDSFIRTREGLLIIHPDQPRASSPINDSYCVNVLQTGLLAGSQKTIQTPRTSPVNCSVVNPVHFAQGLSQKKDVSPVIVKCHKTELKHLKDASCVDLVFLSDLKPISQLLHET